MKKILVIALFALQACSDAGLIPTGTGAQVSIPRVILNCQTSHCRTNVASPLITVYITTSGCSAPLFGATLSSSTRSISCNGTIGCYGEMTNWVDSSGSSTSTIASSSYDICACVDYTATGTGWGSCNTIGSKTGVAISTTTGLQTLSSWVDQ